MPRAPTPAPGLDPWLLFLFQPSLPLPEQVKAPALVTVMSAGRGVLQLKRVGLPEGRTGGLQASPIRDVVRPQNQSLGILTSNLATLR